MLSVLLIWSICVGQLVSGFVFSWHLGDLMLWAVRNAVWEAGTKEEAGEARN